MDFLVTYFAIKSLNVDIASATLFRASSSSGPAEDQLHLVLVPPVLLHALVPPLVDGLDRVLEGEAPQTGAHRAHVPDMSQPSIERPSVTNI